MNNKIYDYIPVVLYGPSFSRHRRFVCDNFDHGIRINWPWKNSPRDRIWHNKELFHRGGSCFAKFCFYSLITACERDVRSSNQQSTLEATNNGIDDCFIQRQRWKHNNQTYYRSLQHQYSQTHQFFIDRLFCCNTKDFIQSWDSLHDDIDDY